jgi:hypothetical protein
MSQPIAQTAKSRDFARAVRAACEGLDWQQLKIFARLSPAHRAQIIFELCEFAQGLLIASERQRAPQASDDEILRRVAARIKLSYGH